ncbi:MAG TPA: hypothetical protein VLI69_01365 [Gammaproteobacteria bacterium]|nr:hypothetical protein [Gammaproteobacteria bacterium]
MRSLEKISFPPIKKTAELHPNIINMLFENKKEILRKLSDLRALHFIDHISITVINEFKKIAVFSITPSVEFNLIVHGLWKFDNSFFPETSEDNTFFWWEEGYEISLFGILKEMKEAQHNFTLGLSLVRKYEKTKIVYSFATRSQNANLKDYYFDNINELFKIGDYGYKLIENIYHNYAFIKSPFKINSSINKPNLRLITNKFL